MDRAGIELRRVRIAKRWTTAELAGKLVVDVAQLLGANAFTDQSVAVVGHAGRGSTSRSNFGSDIPNHLGETGERKR